MSPSRFEAAAAWITHVGPPVTKAAPPTAVSAATIAGYPLNEVVIVLTICYTILLIIHKLYSMYNDIIKPRMKGDQCEQSNRSRTQPPP